MREREVARLRVVLVRAAVECLLALDPLFAAVFVEDDFDAGFFAAGFVLEVSGFLSLEDVLGSCAVAIPAKANSTTERRTR